jgi:hypothetical protein
MALDEVTIKLHLDMTLNGEPITKILEAPAEMEELKGTHGMVIHLHLDADKFAKVMSQVMVQQVRRYGNGKREA